MTIPHFADQQNLVFAPALGALLVAVVLVCLPIVFAPAVRRLPRVRARVLVGAAVAGAAAALVVFGWQAGAGVRTLQAERDAVAAWLRTDRGLTLTAGQVGELVDGGSPRVALAAQSRALGIEGPPATHPLQLRPVEAGSDEYELTYAKRAWPGP